MRTQQEHLDLISLREFVTFELVLDLFIPLLPFLFLGAHSTTHVGDNLVGTAGNKRICRHCNICQPHIFFDDLEEKEQGYVVLIMAEWMKMMMIAVSKASGGEMSVKL